MKLSEKIINLRKRSGMSQEDLAEKLYVSRQAVSRWEAGSAQPDSSNILQLSKLFDVTTDYLLKDDCEIEHDVSAVKKTEITASHRYNKKIIALCASAFGLLGNFVIYILSRFIAVEIPFVTYDGEKTWYSWNGRTGYSYKYFIQKYNLEFLTAIFWILFAIDLIIAFVSKEKIKEIMTKRKEKKQNKKPEN